ncbi:hypothetical protein AAMO2058_001021800 [Amorphochlora amoebiformis]
MDISDSDIEDYDTPQSMPASCVEADECWEGKSNREPKKATGLVKMVSGASTASPLCVMKVKANETEKDERKAGTQAQAKMLSSKVQGQAESKESNLERGVDGNGKIICVSNEGEYGSDMAFNDEVYWSDSFNASEIRHPCFDRFFKPGCDFFAAKCSPLGDTKGKYFCVEFEGKEWAGEYYIVPEGYLANPSSKAYPSNDILSYNSSPPLEIIRSDITSSPINFDLVNSALSPLGKEVVEEFWDALVTSPCEALWAPDCKWRLALCVPSQVVLGYHSKTNRLILDHQNPLDIPDSSWRWSHPNKTCIKIRYLNFPNDKTYHLHPSYVRNMQHPRIPKQCLNVLASALKLVTSALYESENGTLNTAENRFHFAAKSIKDTLEKKVLRKSMATSILDILKKLSVYCISRAGDMSTIRDKGCKFGLKVLSKKGTCPHFTGRLEVLQQIARVLDNHVPKRVHRLISEYLDDGNFAYVELHHWMKENKTSITINKGQHWFPFMLDSRGLATSTYQLRVRRNIKKKAMSISIPSALCRSFTYARTFIAKGLLSTEIPEEIRMMRNLHTVDLSSNHLKSVPEALCEIKSLQSLSLGNNLLTSLPKNLGSKIPSGLSKCKSLKKLILSSNRFSTPPEVLRKIPLQSLYIDGNPLIVTSSQMFSSLDELHMDATQASLPRISVLKSRIARIVVRGNINANSSISVVGRPKRTAPRISDH